MRVAFPGIAALAVVIALGIPATAHHSQAFYFDTTKAITLEGEILRVEWINPHILLFVQSKNEKGDLETWIIEGSSPNNALRRVGFDERFVVGKKKQITVEQREERRQGAAGDTAALADQGEVEKHSLLSQLTSQALFLAGAGVEHAPLALWREVVVGEG